MSAFVVGHNHINALMNYAVGAKLYLRGALITAETATEIGQILLAENERSVRTRYPDCTSDDMPGTVGETADTYHFKENPLAMHLSPIAVIKACRCLDYQCCETDDWEETEAYRIVKSLESYAVHKLPGYDAAAWEIC